MQAAWAKLRRDCQQGRSDRCRASCDCAELGRLSLIAHSADVAACLDALLERPAISRRLARLLGQHNLTGPDRSRLIALAALHDLGKVNWRFQQVPFNKRRGGGGHVKPLLALAENYFVPLADGGGLFSVEHLLLSEGQSGPFEAVMAHHGHLPAVKAHDADLSIWAVHDGYDPAQACRDLIAAIRTWVPEAFTPSPIAWTPEFGHAFAGLLMLADWLGSDSGCFKFPEDGAPEGVGRFAWSRQKARELLVRRSLAPEPTRKVTAALRFEPEVLTTFAKPSAAQAAMLALPPAPDGRICLIEDETGAGKTEAALIHFLDLFRRGDVDGMYFALPTRAAARQIHGRIEKALQRLLGSVSSVILAVPGYLPTGGDAPLPDPAVQLDDDSQAAARDALWASERPKRYLAAWVGVGTIDQALMGALRVRHAQLRSSTLLRSLLVVDEVHASDLYMRTILRSLLQQHRRAGGHALLMSATLGSRARVELLQPHGRPTVPDPAGAVATPYPATWSDASTQEPLPHPSVERRSAKRVQVALEPDWDASGASMRLAAEAARSGARVLVIRNTVANVLKTQLALEEAAPELTLSVAVSGRTVATPHHARFAPEDRLLLDAALEALLGKNAPRESGCIVVASQTAEQSLDIDADLLITDLCPADVLLQRIGRLHRHRRPRPQGFADACCVILAPTEVELEASLTAKGEIGRAVLGLGLVYPDLLGVLATRRALAASASVEIPADNRRLVEAATHPATLAGLAESLGGRWRAHWVAQTGGNGALVKTANDACLKWDRPIASLPELDERITARLGLDDRVAELPPGTLGPFGIEITRVTIPGRWVKGVPLDEPTKVAATGAGGLELTLGERRFAYNRLGLRPVSA